MDKAKRGNGTKLMAVTNDIGLVLTLSIELASPKEEGLVKKVLEERFIEPPPEKLIGDRANDSEPLEKQLQASVEMIAPYRKYRVKNKTQDGRKLRSYSRRWKVGRFFARLIKFRITLF